MTSQVWHRAWKRGVMAGILILAAIARCLDAQTPPEVSLDLPEEGDASIVILGNGVGERLQWHGYFETGLQCAFPTRKLSVRNLAFSGDEVGDRRREPGYAGLDGHLRSLRADVLICFFGLNESFAGADGLPKFRSRLGEFIDERRAFRYNTRKAPQLIFVSTLPYLPVGEGPPGEKNVNENLRLYAEAMREVCAAKKAGYLDLFKPFEAAAKQKSRPATDDGLHPNAYGAWLIGKLMSEKLGIALASPGEDYLGAEVIRQKVLARNRAWFHSARPVNGAFAYGARAEPYGVMTFPAELDGLRRTADSAERELASIEKPAPASVWSMEPLEHSPYNPPRGEFQPRVAPPGAADFGRPVEAQGSMKLAEGFEVSLWASEEEAPLASPMAMQFDGRGRLWVVCSPSWPHPLPGHVQDDYLVVLEDLDNDHRFDRHRVFARGLFLPTSLALTAKGAYVAEQRDLVLYEDTNEDGVADTRRVILSGFGTGDTERAISGLRWGPEGSLWFHQGRDIVSRVETPWGSVFASGGAVFRFDPRRQKLEVTSQFVLNRPVAQSADAWGQVMVEEADAGESYPLAQIAGAAPDFSANAATRLPHEDVSGAEWLLSRHFPGQSRDWYVTSQMDGFQGIRAARSWPEGSGVRLEPLEQPLLSSSDPCFRPIASCIGPDGALFILDFCSPLVGNQGTTLTDPRRGHSHGRVWRVQATGRVASWRPVVARQPINVLLEWLREKEPSARELVRQELWSRRSSDVLPELDSWILSLSPDDPDRQQLLVEALWLHQAFGKPDAALLDRVTESPQPLARAAAARVLADWRDQVSNAPNLLQRLMEDEDPRVRLEALQAARKFGTKTAGDIARLAQHYSMDGNLRAVYNAITTELGTAHGAPPSLRAKAMATPTADLLKGELTPVVAAVLMDRTGVDTGGLLRCAVVLARRQQSTTARYFVEQLADRSTPPERLQNVLTLLPQADTWEYSQAHPELREIAETSPSQAAREGAWTAMILGAASNQTLDRLFAEAFGPDERLGLFQGAVRVASLDAVKSGLRAALRQELGRPDAPSRRSARYVRVASPGAKVMQFAELQVMAGGKNLALRKNARQLHHHDAPDWWNRNAGAGLNGVTDPALEKSVWFSDTTDRPIAGVTVGGPDDGSLDPWWEIDLGSSQGIDELVFHPMPRGLQSSRVRFELRDAEGKLIWTAWRAASDLEPIHVDVQPDQESIEAAVVIARGLGEEFRNALIATAEHGESTAVRFSAMRALSRLGGTPPHLSIRQLRVEVGEKLAYQPNQLQADPNQPVQLTLANADGPPMNIAVLKPGEEASTSSVPDDGRVLFASATIVAGQTALLEFIAPSTPGDYPLTSATPDLWQRLHGVLKVTGPKPPLAPGAAAGAQ